MNSFLLFILCFLALVGIAQSVVYPDNESIRKSLAVLRKIEKIIFLEQECRVFPKADEKIITFDENGLAIVSIKTCVGTVHPTKEVYTGHGSSCNPKWCYEGDFENGQFSGKGKMTYAKGNIQEGIFNNGSFQQGNGVYIYYQPWPDRDLEATFKGELDSDGLPNGEGTIYDIAGKVIYEGTVKSTKTRSHPLWKNALNGYGTIYYPSGKKYYGFFTNGKSDDNWSLW